MKTKKLKYFTTGLMFLLVLGACNDLDRFPFASIEQSQSFQTVRDAQTWNTGMYSQLRGRVYGIFTYTTDIQGDQLNASMDFGNRAGAPHRWDWNAGDNSLSGTWSAYYYGITNVNVAIAGFATIQTTTEAQATELARYTSEAHLTRAYYYHELVKLFAKSYDPATAASDLGVPLMLEYDINNFLPRSSVAEVYAQIMSDIAAAKTGLAGVAGTQGARRYTADVVTALEARVKLDMRDWPGAKIAADQLINSGRYPLYTTVAGLETYWYNDGRQEDILQLFADPATGEGAQTNQIYLGFSPGINSIYKYVPDFLPTQAIIDLYPAGDHRKGVYFKNLPVTLDGTRFDDLILVNKYPGNPALRTGANTNYQHAPKVFRIAEMYLISAEAAVMGTGDAATPLNALRVARGLDALAAVTLADVKAERTRELAFEGFRINDLKRWNEGLNRGTPQDLDPIQIGPLYHLLTKPAGDPMFVWGIPANDITVNTNLVQNPGW